MSTAWKDNVAGALYGSAAFAVASMSGGLLALGAVVAPKVFGGVPAPLSGDTMTQIFAGWDRVSMACAIYALVIEGAVAAWRGEAVRGLHSVRAALAFVLLALVAARFLWLTPAIAELHFAGAVRSVGEAGMRIEHLHQWAKKLGSTEALASAAYVILHIVCALSRATSRRNRDGHVTKSEQ